MPASATSASAAGLRLRGLALDDEGVLPDALDAACRSEPARLLVLNPTIHNPTTATMSAERCRAIAALAREHDLIVVEDDVYGRLPEQRAPPIATLAPERTIYITSASKSVAPGLRLGMLLCPQRYLEPIAEAQHDLFLTCPPLMAELFKLWQGNGTAQQPGAAPAGRGARAAGPGARDPGQSRATGRSRPPTTSGCRCRRPGAPRSSSPPPGSAAWRSIRARRSRSIATRRRTRCGSRSAPPAAASACNARCDPGGAARRAARPAPRGHLERPEAAICRPRISQHSRGSRVRLALRFAPAPDLAAGAHLAGRTPCAQEPPCAAGKGRLRASRPCRRRQKVGAAWRVLPQ